MNGILSGTPVGKGLEEAGQEGESMELPYKNREWLRRKYWGEDKSQREIAEEAGVHQSTISCLFKKYGIPNHLEPWTRERVIRELKELEKRFGKSPSESQAGGKIVRACQRLFGSWNGAKQVAELDLCKPSGSHPRHIPESSRELTSSKAYLLGVLGPGDGCIEKVHEIYYTLSLCATDIDFVLDFKGRLDRVYKLKTTFFKRQKLVRNARKPQYRVRLHSIEAVRDILSYAPIESFRHHQERVPSAIKSADPQIKATYVRGVFDSQGWATYRKISMAKSNKKVLEEIKTLLENLGMVSHLHKQSKDTSRYGESEIWTLDISSLPSMKRFAQIIGSSIERKKRKLDEIVSRGYTSLTLKRSFEYKRLLPKMVQLRKLGYSYPRIAQELGLDKQTVGKYLRGERILNPPTRWTREKIVCELKSLASSSGKSPSESDADSALYRACQRYFSGWNRAKEAAGLELCRPGLAKWSKQRVIEELKKLGERLGRSPRCRETPHYLEHACRRYFGSFNDAKRAAGLECFR